MPLPKVLMEANFMCAHMSKSFWVKQLGRDSKHINKEFILMFASQCKVVFYQYAGINGQCPENVNLM